MGNYKYNRSRNNRNDDDAVSKIISWIVSIAFLCAFPPIGVFLVIKNIISASNAKKQRWTPPWEQSGYSRGSFYNGSHSNSQAGTNTTGSYTNYRTGASTSGSYTNYRTGASTSGSYTNYRTGASASNSYTNYRTGASASNSYTNYKTGTGSAKTSPADGRTADKSSASSGTSPVGGFKGGKKSSSHSAPHAVTPADAAAKRLNTRSIVFMIIGLVLGGISLFPLTSNLYWVFNGLFWWEDFVFPGLMFLVGSGFLVGSIFTRRKMNRYKKYTAIIGSRRAVKISHIAAAIPTSFKSACSDLQKMINKGYFGPTAYLDMDSKYLLMSYEDRPEPEKSTVRESQAQPDSYQSIILEIRRLNDEIADDVVSAKIDRIENLTAKIFRQVEENPDKVPQIRSFMSYYLPTTLKLLGSYSQLERQGIDGKNISGSKAQIEGILDTLITGFERQLDRLFEDDMIDVSSDIEVLETMLRKDGLSSVSPFGSFCASGEAQAQSADSQI